MFTDQVTTLAGWCFQLRTRNNVLQQYHSAADIQATWPTTAPVCSSAKSKADLLSPGSSRYRYILNHQESSHAQKRPGSERSRRWNRTTKPLLRVTYLPRRPKGELSLPLRLWQAFVTCPLFFSPFYSNYSSRFSGRCFTRLTGTLR